MMISNKLIIQTSTVIFIRPPGHINTKRGQGTDGGTHGYREHATWSGGSGPAGLPQNGQGKTLPAALRIFTHADCFAVLVIEFAVQELNGCGYDSLLTITPPLKAQGRGRMIF
jgi:hypothetical protein